MEIGYATTKLARQCESDQVLRKVYGPRCAGLIQRRLFELDAAAHLAEMRTVATARCHLLTGDRKSQYAVDLVHPKRLVFEPFGDPMPMLEDGGINESKVTAVMVVGIVDYH